jgi:hypothetical protein
MATRRLIAIAIAGVVGAVLLLLLALALANNPDVQNNLGEPVFTVGVAESLAEEIDERGPLLFQDLLGGDRDIIVDHVGDDDWIAYTARLGRGCRLELERDTGDLRNSCTKVTVRPRTPAEVRELGGTPYGAAVDEDGDVVVDLRQPAP